MGDGLGNRAGFSVGGGVSLKINFRGGVSVGAGVGVSHLSKNVMFGLNTSVNVYNSGVGTRSGVLGKPDIFYTDLAISPSVTIPFSPRNNIKNPATLNTFNNNSISGVMNYYKNSASLASNFVFNSHGRNQRVGYLGIKLNQFDFNFYNDVIRFLGDREDRWWTGGGSLNIGPLSIATDVFTGVRDPNSSVYNPQKGKDEWLPSPVNLAQGKKGTYIQTCEQRAYNKGQTLLLLRNPNGLVGFYVEGKGQMWSQNFIHNHLSSNLLFYSLANRQYGIIGKYSGF